MKQARPRHASIQLTNWSEFMAVAGPGSSEDVELLDADNTGGMIWGMTDN